MKVLEVASNIITRVARRGKATKIHDAANSVQTMIEDTVILAKKPPKLGAKANPDLPHDTPWVDPSGRWVPGEILNNVPKEELQRILFRTERGGLYLLPHIGLRGLIRVGGINGLRHMLEELGVARFSKAVVKNTAKDKYMDTWPVAANGHWVSAHDAEHIRIARELAPIRMGSQTAYVNGQRVREPVMVNGIDGIPAGMVPHFHPLNPTFLGNYNGMRDEYRVAIDNVLTSPRIINRVRLGYYVLRHPVLVPRPLAAIRAHKATMIEAGTLPQK